MRTAFVTLLLCACGSDAAPIENDVDAAVAIDAPVDAPEVCPGVLESCDDICVNTTIDREHCGGCNRPCTAAARCDDSACECPAPFIGGTHQVLATTMLQAPTGFVSGAVGLVGIDGGSHGVVVTAAAAAPRNTPLAMNDQVFVAIAYEVITANQSRATYLASAGTVTLARRCSAGIAGTLANVTLAEVDPVTFALVPNGCGTTVSQLAFDIGAACP